MSNICAGIGRGQMTVLDEHIAITAMYMLFTRMLLKVWMV